MGVRVQREVGHKANRRKPAGLSGMPLTRSGIRRQQGRHVDDARQDWAANARIQSNELGDVPKLTL